MALLPAAQDIKWFSNLHGYKSKKLQEQLDLENNYFIAIWKIFRESNSV